MKVRHRRRWITLVVVALGALLFEARVRAPRSRSGDDLPTGPVLVTSIVDGDTIDVEDGSRRIRVRLKCVDTPEIAHRMKPAEAYGPEAAAYTERSLAGTWVRLESDPQDRWDHYGRLLAYVFLQDGTLYNLTLLRQGWARTTRYPCRFRREALAAEREARTGERGIWSSVVATAAAPAGAIIGNSRSRVYHVPGQASYESVSRRNRVYFDTEEAARRAGYRRARR